MPAPDRYRRQRRQEQSRASWILVAASGAFFLAVFVFAPESLPSFKQQMLGLVAALLAGTFAFFLTGNLGIDIHWLSERFGQIGVKGAGGLAVFVVVLGWWQIKGPVAVQGGAGKSDASVARPKSESAPTSPRTEAVAETDREVALATQALAQKPTDPGLLNDLGLAQYKAGKYLDARATFEKAMNRAKGDGVHAEIAVSSANNLTQTLVALGHLPEARELGEKTEQEAEQILGPQNRARIDAMSVLASLREGQGDFMRAYDLRQRLLVLYREVQGEKDPETLGIWNNLALNLFQQGKLAAAADQQRSLLLTAQKALGKEDASTLQYESNFAWTLLMQGRLAEARRHLEHAIPGLDKSFGPEHPATLSARNCLADVLRGQGHLEDAARLREEILEKWSGSLGEEAPGTLRAEEDLALDRYALSDLPEARKLENHVLVVRRRTLGEDHLLTLRAKADLAVTLRAQGDLAGARKFLEEAVVGRRQQLGEHHPDTSSTEWELALTLEKLGDTAARAPLLERLRWLIQAKPEELSAEQRKIAKALPALLPK